MYCRNLCKTMNVFHFLSSCVAVLCNVRCSNIMGFLCKTTIKRDWGEKDQTAWCVIVIVFQNSTLVHIHTEDYCTVRCGPVFLQLNSWMFPTSIKLIQCVYLKWFSNKNSDMMSKLDKKTRKITDWESKFLISYHLKALQK